MSLSRRAVLANPLLRVFWRRNPQIALAQASRELVAKRDDADAGAVLADLRNRTAAWAAAADGLSNMRTELMDSVDRNLIHHALLELDAGPAQAILREMPELPGSRPDLARLIEAGELRIQLMRRWAGLYYGDQTDGDWFDTYRRAAEMRKSSAARDLERVAGSAVTATHNNIDAAIRGLNTSLRLRLLQAPRGKKIRQRSLASRPHRRGGLHSSPSTAKNPDG